VRVHERPAAHMAYLEAMHAANDVVVLERQQAVVEDEVEGALERQQLLLARQQEAAVEELDVDLEQEELLPEDLAAARRVLSLQNRSVVRRLVPHAQGRSNRDRDAP